MIEKCLLPPVVTAEMNAKYHLNQKVTDRFTVTNVFRSINHKIEAEDLDSVEDLEEVEMIGALDSVEDLEEIDQERCLMQPVATVEMNVKYHSNQKKKDLFIATNVFKNINKIRNFLIQFI